MLDLSGNELSALPGVDTLAPTLSALRLSRNWFTAVPPEVAGLELLKVLDLSRNFVRGSDDALEIAKLKPSVSAESYMIIRSPTDFTAKLGAGSRKARQAADKFAKYTRLWELADTVRLAFGWVGFSDSFQCLHTIHFVVRRWLSG